MNTCRYPSCDREALGSDAPAGVRGRFCSPKCDVRHEHIKADARDARRADMEGRA